MALALISRSRQSTRTPAKAARLKETGSQPSRDRSNAPVQRTGFSAADRSIPQAPIIQAKLKIGAPNDKYEQEADRIAEQVMRMPDKQVAGLSKGATKIQRKCSSCTSGQGLCPTCAGKKAFNANPSLDTLSRQEGITAEPVVVKAAEALAKKMKWAGRVRAVFHHGGRLLVLAGVTADVIKIYRVQNKRKAIIVSTGGWEGAILASAAFGTWFAPADTAGPLAWAGHGVGTLVAGGIGYWVGSKTTRIVYELIAE